MNITPLDAALGAEINDIDLSQSLSDSDFETIYSTWLEHSVLVFRNQQLTEQSLVDFSRRIGSLEMPPAGETRIAGDGGAEMPEVWTISNVRVNGESIGALGNLEADWHSDMSYREDPPAASILYAREIPSVGANTSFASMYAALEAMPEELRRKIEPLHVRHDSAYTSVGTLRADADEVSDITEVEGATHPTILPHPETGRNALFMGRRLNASFIELDPVESESLLDSVWAHCANPGFVYEHIWQASDLIMWDNRCTLHRRDAFDDSERRVMWRTQIGQTSAPSA